MSEIQIGLQQSESQLASNPPVAPSKRVANKMIEIYRKACKQYEDLKSENLECREVSVEQAIQESMSRIDNEA